METHAYAQGSRNAAHYVRPSRCVDPRCTHEINHAAFDQQCAETTVSSAPEHWFDS